MRVSTRRMSRSACVALGLLTTASLPAQDLASEERLDLAAAPAVTEGELADVRGRDDLYLAQLNDLDATGTVSGNTAVGGMTGDNIISDHALTGLNGVTTVIQNTGNNVLIQESMILNVHIQE